ncbi:hypothetical protein Hypma_011386 [Hypsizygus marmoreus]|uniref:Uncharacterized protein n=1 Tax=Hypsizygus marmoreus TaxID=39966 RepID=A0A369JLS6_HYPMA|nr:hypothetical protein Hypma_011386 [Hypsizygus marmoreus]
MVISALKSNCMFGALPQAIPTLHNTCRERDHKVGQLIQVCRGHFCLDASVCSGCSTGRKCNFSAVENIVGMRSPAVGKLLYLARVIPHLTLRPRHDGWRGPGAVGSPRDDPTRWVSEAILCSLYSPRQGCIQFALDVPSWFSSTSSTRSTSVLQLMPPLPVVTLNLALKG